MTAYLTVTDHHRVADGYRYIYPVISRRAGGVSVGINLNTNHACNWRCIYCQVPNLQRGTASLTDIQQLKTELVKLLDHILHGNFMQTYVPEGQRHLVDIAFSGDGEPTTSQAFSACIDVVHDVLIQFKLLHQIVVRVISNGSQMHRPHVLSAVKKLSAMNGEVWFKLDAGTATDILRINDVNLQPEQHLSKLLKCATYCPTWIQTCVFKYHGYLPTEDHLNAYLACLKKVQHQIQGVLLYGVARASFQSEAPWIEQLDNSELSSIAKRIEALGIQVKVSA